MTDLNYFVINECTLAFDQVYAVRCEIPIIDPMESADVVVPCLLEGWKVDF